MQGALVAVMGAFALLRPASGEAAVQCWQGSACVPTASECGDPNHRCTGCPPGVSLVCEAGSPENGCAGNEDLIYCGFAT